MNYFEGLFFPLCYEVPLQIFVVSVGLIVHLKLLSVALLFATLLLEDEHRLVKGLNRCSLHLDLLRHKENIH